eukprot:4301340-Amphidinium_carterae.1
MNGQPMPMQTQTANFPNSTGFCKDCGQAETFFPPPGIGTPMTNGAKTQTPSAATASPVPNLNFSNYSRSGGAGGSTQPRPGGHQGYESF